MGLETFDFIPDLVDTNPTPTDPVAQGDDHLRGIKFTLQNQFPVIGENAVDLTALQLNDAALKSEDNIFSADNEFTGPIQQFTDENLRITQSADNVSGKQSWYDENAFQRWSWGRGPSTSQGNFELRRFDAAGNLLDAPIAFDSALGNATFSGRIRGPDGLASNATFGFTSEPTTGMFLGAAGVVGFTALGVLGMSIRSTGNAGIFAGTDVPFQADGNLTSPGLPAYTFSNDTNTGMFRLGADSIGFATGAVTQMAIDSAGITADVSFLGRDGSITNPTYAFSQDIDTGLFRTANNSMALVTGALEAIGINSAQTIKLRKENEVTRLVDTQARTGWRYTQANGNPMWAIYAGTTPSNTLAFQRYNDAGAFQDIPFSIRQLNGLIRMSTLPTSSAGLIQGELWRNPVSPGFVAIV